MNLQRLVEIELLRLNTAPGTLGVADSEDARLACLSLLYRFGLIDDSTHLSTSVSIIRSFDSVK